MVKIEIMEANDGWTMEVTCGRAYDEEDAGFVSSCSFDTEEEAVLSLQDPRNGFWRKVEMELGLTGKLR